MRIAGGYMTVTDVDGKVEERDTFTCAHANEIVVVRPGEDPATVGAHCKLCDKLICRRCASKQECIPFERWLAFKEGGIPRDAQNAVKRQIAEAEFRARNIEVANAANYARQIGGPHRRDQGGPPMQQNVDKRLHDAYLAERFGHAGRR